MLDWDMARDHLYLMKRIYEEAGWEASLALAAFINPLVKRFEDGERTTTLYDDIMSIA